MEAATAEETMAEWSDGRRDEFAVRMDERFDRIDERFVEVDRRFDRVDERFNEVDRRVDRRFDKVDHELGRINDRLDDLSKIMIGGIITFTAAVLSGFIAIVALVATQI